MTTASIPSLICFAAFAQRLAGIIGGIQARVAARGGRDHPMVPTVVAVWKRLNRLAARFGALMGRLKEGRTVPPRSRGGERGERIRVAREAPDEALRLPWSYGWLLRLLPETREYWGQVHALCTDPQVGELLAADPRAGRILRAMCRMMRIEPEGALALPPRRRRRAPKEADPEAANPEMDGPEAPKPRTPGPRLRAAKPPSAAPPDEAPSAVSQVWAALLAHTAPVANGPVTPNPRARKPPWWIPGR